MYYRNREYAPCKQELKLYNETDWHLHSMKIGTLWPRCNSVVTFATPQVEKIPRLTAFTSFLQNPLLLKIPLPFSNFSIPSFLGFLVSSIPPFKKGEGGGGVRTVGPQIRLPPSKCFIILHANQNKCCPLIMASL